MTTDPHPVRTPRSPRTSSPQRPTAGALLAASHPGPAAAVTALACLLAVAAGLDVGDVVLVTAAVAAGQLTIGWGNDLLDRERDRAVGRIDKPLARGDLPPSLARGWLLAAAAVCVALSLACGWQAGLVHVVLLVGMGHAYNLGLKATAWSWLPYAVAFGSLPAVVTLAGDRPAVAPWWQLAAGALLGVGAHLANALPDLDDDLRTGVRGLPHRLGPAASRTTSGVLLAAASVLVVLAPAGSPPAWTLVALLGAGVLLGVILAGRGRLPFRAVMALALLDVVLLVAAG